MKKIGLIAIIAVLTLGIIGVGYAAWTQTLNITGSATVATFNVSMIWNNSRTGATSEDPTSSYNTVAHPVGLSSTVGLGQPTDSDATTFTVSADTADQASYNEGTGANAGLIVTITNAVPGTYVIPGVQIYNQSTIPVGVTVTGTTTNGTDLDASSWVSLGAGLTTTDPVAATTGKTTAADVTIVIPDDATQGGTYSFIVNVTANQS